MHLLMDSLDKNLLHFLLSLFQLYRTLIISVMRLHFFPRNSHQPYLVFQLSNILLWSNLYSHLSPLIFHKHELSSILYFHVNSIKRMHQRILVIMNASRNFYYHCKFLKTQVHFNPFRSSKKHML